MDKKLFGIILVVVVGVIMAGSLLAPIVSDYADEEKIYYNEGVPYTEYDGNDHTIIVSYDGTAYNMTVDGESVETPDLTLYGSATIVYGTGGFIRLASNGYVRGFQSAGMGGLNVDEDTSVTVSLFENYVTLSDGETSLTYNFAPTYYVSTEGDYVLCLNPCVVEDTVILAGITNYNDDEELIAYVGSGTVDGITASVVYASLTDSKTVSSVSAAVNTSTVTTDLLKIDSIVFTAVLSDSSEYTATFSYFLAPSEVSYENPTYLGSATSGLLAVVVVMFLVALIIIPTRLFNRDD